MSEKKESHVIITNILNFMWGFLFLLFPLFFLTLTTETFVFPKQIIIAIVVLASLLIFGVKAILEKKVRFRQTFLDLPLFLFLLSLFLSAIFSVDRLNSIISFIPILLLGLGYFVITNTLRKEQIAFFFVSALLTSAAITALLSIFTFLKTYIFPFAFTHVQWFTPFGSLLDQAIYFAALLPIALYFSYPLLKGKNDTRVLSFALVTVILVAGLSISVYQLLTSQKPVILPFTTGFQIAFASISQDSPRIAQGFFSGSGVGSFFTAFTRFKQPAFNLNQNLWFLNFTQSTSFILELLTTTGLLGLLSFLFILAKALGKPLKTIDNPIFFSITILGIASFIFPFSFTTLALFFFLLALYSSAEGLKNPERSFDLEFSLLALRRNLFNIQTEAPQTHKPSQVLPITFLLLILIFTGFVGFYSVKYVISDVLFNQSLVAASANNGSLTYQKQVQAINTFPYRDGFYRIFSQTNLSIANSLLALNANKQQTAQNNQSQQTALNLIQQSITVGRTATSLSPINTLNWQNLASIYRSLINFGQNADQFAIATTQQAIVLDSANPQEYLALGGLYYQVGQYDNAIRQFQVAVNLKPDYPNAYYNLGHAYEAKNDYQNALANYQTVRNLVANDKTNLDKITVEIDAVSKKANAGAGTTDATTTPQPKAVTPVPSQEPLNINQPTTELPQQSAPVKLPAPTTVTKKPTVTPTPTK